MSILEPKHTLFDSVDIMLAPESLSGLLSHPITHVDCQPMTEHNGLAGGRLCYVNTNVGRLVLKLMSSEYDWIMLSSDDQQCRSVTLWQYGLLDQLRPHVEHKILACAHDNGTWAILMDDLTEHVFEESKQMPPDLLRTFLDSLARLHATFWNDPRLRDPNIGLCDEAQLLDLSTPPMAQKHKNLLMGWIPEAVRGGGEILAELLDPDVYIVVHNLFENPSPLFEALSRYPYTLLHGDYRDANLGHQESEQPIAFDWQMAACSLMTIDLAWFIGGDSVRSGLGEEQAIDYYRKRLEEYLNKQFDNGEWQSMIELGIFFHVLRIICIDAYLYKHADNPKEKQIFETELKEYNQKIRDGIRWL